VPSLTPRVAANEWGHAALFAGVGHLDFYFPYRHAFFIAPQSKTKKKLGKKGVTSVQGNMKRGVMYQNRRPSGWCGNNLTSREKLQPRHPCSYPPPPSFLFLVQKSTVSLAPLSPKASHCVAIFFRFYPSNHSQEGALPGPHERADTAFILSTSRSCASASLPLATCSRSQPNHFPLRSIYPHSHPFTQARHCYCTI